MVFGPCVECFEGIFQLLGFFGIFNVIVSVFENSESKNMVLYDL